MRCHTLGHLLFLDHGVREVFRRHWPFLTDPDPEIVVRLFAIWEVRLVSLIIVIYSISIDIRVTDGLFICGSVPLRAGELGDTL